MPLLTASLILVFFPAHADQPEQSAAQLKQLKSQIEQLNKRLNKELSRKQSLAAQLGQLEQRIGTLHTTLASLVKQAHQLERRSHTLNKAVQASKEEAQASRGALSDILRASFILGREPRLKLALDGEDPARIARTLAYYGYYSRTQAQRIEKLVATIAQYNRDRTQLAATQREISRNADQQRRSLANLKQEKQQRETVVQQLQKEISGKQARLAQLERDAKRLEKVVQSVHHDLEEVPAGKLAQVNFPALRGKLPWPVAGEIVNRYGSSRADDGALKWEAIRIAAPAGTKVHAMAYGRIAYAGWLPFYGLVLMVDHGNGYLVVYGHNEALYKQVGEWVEPGDVISTVGQSGGQPRPMLYFQIRHGKRPLNPARWCRGNKPRR